jgi:hypothetical protein
MLWLRQGLLTATVVLMLGAVFVAVTPFDDGPVRCGSPLSGASVQTEDPDGVLTPSNCGDKGVTRLVYATGLFTAALLASLAILLAWALLTRRPQASGTGLPTLPPPLPPPLPAPPSDVPPVPAPSPASEASDGAPLPPGSADPDVPPPVPARPAPPASSEPSVPAE